MSFGRKCSIQLRIYGNDTLTSLYNMVSINSSQKSNSIGDLKPAFIVKEVLGCFTSPESMYDRSIIIRTTTKTSFLIDGRSSVTSLTKEYSGSLTVLVLYRVIVA